MAQVKITKKPKAYSANPPGILAFKRVFLSAGAILKVHILPHTQQILVAYKKLTDIVTKQNNLLTIANISNRSKGYLNHTLLVKIVKNFNLLANRPMHCWISENLKKHKDAIKVGGF
ncbi:MAG: hypothetical protein JRE16_04950 [Deltaproteobacteria bacterium]|nr:hypothetical protein [Deltaproteobacteria bacterium]MBW2477445.1 hypothetical protein [Deltaproteobacteria bacterium]MBW2503901.1 hypothetical protein [Deltaproteobacteria bacterium]MBW2520423.1 hypothetical protein [Deltaproteobacteria bacterium]